MKRAYFLTILLTLNLISCNLIQQATELSSFVKCKFKINTVEDVMLSGVDVMKIKDYSQLNFMDIAKLSSAITSGELPLNFTLNLKVNNPNQKQAAMNKLEWILLIDDVEMNKGMLSQRIEIPAGSDAILPLQMSMNLKEVFKGKSLQSLVNFGMNLVDASGKITRIKLMAKPTIMVAGKSVAYPEYITISNDF